MKKTVALHNLGCKVNAYELEAIQQLLENRGYEIVPFAPGADVYIINTCTVTNIADRKSRQMLHKAKKMNPDAVVVACGCYVQAAGEKLEEDTAIDLIIGNNKKKDLVDILENFLAEREDGGKPSDAECKSFLVDMTHNREYETLSISKTAEHTRAFLKVQDGCNQFCTYCIIPYARGRVRSRRQSDVVEEVKRLVEAGYQEVVLTGIHLSSYGIDFENEDNLLSLIRAVHEIEGIKRIRLGSLEPRIITEEFVQAIAALPKMCPHFHLSLQSGCNETLKRMNRRYTSEEFYEKCEILRKYFEKPALTTDVIVGFPQETEEEFETTYEFLKKICFYETHIFKYSKREGTKAAVMQGQIPEQIKAKRSARLIELGEKNRRAYEESFLGKTVEVLVEEKSDVNGKEMWTGHTKEYMKIALESEKNLQNCILNVQIKDGREIIH